VVGGKGLEPMTLSV